MKSLIFKELLLLSNQQRRARRVLFNPKATIISGANGTGKSQILKSIYACFGATPDVKSELIEMAALRLLLHFSVDSREYFILRDGDSYTLFDGNQRVLGVYRSMSGGFATELARIFDFHLEFYTSKDEPRAAHPRYLFAPFYIDQDFGWTSPWTSFAKLRASRRTDTIEYHVGIRPNSYYQAKAKLRQFQSEEAGPKAQRATLERVLDKVGDSDAGVRFSMDMESYSREVEQLLLACRRLQQQEEAFRERIVDLENERMQLHLGMEIAGRAAIEFQKDFTYAAHSRLAEIECPTCGAKYANGIVERFGIVRDEIQCEDLHASLADRVAVLDEKLISEQKLYEATKQELNEASATLNIKQTDLSLRDVIHAEGKKELRDSIAADIAEVDKTIDALNSQMADARRIMKAASDRKLKEQILNSYRSRLQATAVDLQASPLPPEMLTGIAPKIPSGSSEFPRRLLAYFVAILHIVRNNTSSTYCPVVVDTVNQQDQSEQNLARMYGLLANGLPVGTQLILGCVDTKGIRFPGEAIHLDEKHGLLREGEFKESLELISKLIDARFKFEHSMQERGNGESALA